MVQLGKIEKITDLRSVWKHEALDFSKWLAKEENSQELSDTIGISIVSEELESSVGSFSVDILATDQATGRKIIIENQLEDTNHDHLGKIITYASGKDAKVIIWIVRRARDEHRQAIEWLNQNTDEEIGFFLLEIELWKIGNSAPAPKFNIVVRPNDWAKTEKVKVGLSEIQKLQLEYWQTFSNYAFSNEAFSEQFSKRKVSAQHWYDTGAGNSTYHICFTVNTQKKRIGADIYISDDKLFYGKIKEHEISIEAEIGFKLEWISASKACRIIAYKNGDIKNSRDNWDDYFAWQTEIAIKLNEIIKKYTRLSNG